MKKYDNILLSTRKYKLQRDYWFEMLKHHEVEQIIPPDNESEKTNRAEDALPQWDALIEHRLKPDVAAKLIAVSKNSDETLFILLIAAYQALLYKYTGKTEIYMASPVYCVNGKEYPFNDYIVLGGKLSGVQTFKEVLLAMRATFIKVIENQDYPFEKIIEELNYSTERDYGLLFHQEFASGDIHKQVNDAPAEPPEKKKKTAGLAVRYRKEGNGLRFEFRYNRSRYREDKIKQLVRCFDRQLEAITADFNVKLADMEILGEQEKQELLIDFNNTAEPYPQDKTIPELFRLQVEAAPGKIAVTGEESENAALTYRQLDDLSEKYARRLRKEGLGPEDIAVLMMERTVQSVVALMAIIKTGAAYLPVDPKTPPQRLLYILADSGAKLMVTDSANRQKAAGEDILQILMEEEDDESIENSGEPGEASGEKQPAPGNPAYIIYTSGTTGNPKGVIIEHRSAVNYICWAASQYVKNEPVNFPLYTTMAFDLTVTSVFTPLLTGNTVIVYGENAGDDTLGKIIRNPKIGAAKLTPSHLKMLRHKEMTEKKTSIKRFVVGGEELETGLAGEIHHRFSGEIEIYNEYGPTEATVGCMIHRYRPEGEDGVTVSIGKPAANTKIYLLDNDLKPVPPGAEGEIYISGRGLARGYLNKPHQTAERFIDNPGEPGQKMYKTGDRGRWQPGGNIEFLGRIDQQVKIRGYRIELAEIENRLKQQPGIVEAVVIDKTDPNGEKYLCAYVLPKEQGDGKRQETQWREKLAQCLPDYMIPGKIIPVDRIPLTPNGKLDRKALPDPAAGSGGENYVAPRDQLEKQLVEIWAEVLSGGKDDGTMLETIGIDDNFFQLGGHSLNATMLVSRMHKALNVKITLTQMFRTSTIRELAEHIREQAEERYEAIEKTEKRESYALSSAQKRLYILHQMDEGGVGYNVPTAVMLEGTPDRERLEETFRTLIARHESLRTSFHMEDRQPVQRIDESVDFGIREYGNRDGTHVKQAEQVEIKQVIKEFVQPFDLERAPLLRVGLYPLENKDGDGISRYLLMVDMHHIISDGISAEIFVKEFMAVYERQELPPLCIQYRDYAAWQSGDRQKDALKNQENYWKNKFADEIPVLQLPTDRPRPEVQQFEGHRIHFEIDEKETAALNALALQEGVTVYMLMVAIFSVQLAKLSGQEDIVIGTPIAGRKHADLAEIIGMFVNTLALRNAPDGRKRFKQYLVEVKDNTLEAFENQDYQYENLVDQLAVNRDTSRNPLFDVMFVLQSIPALGIEIEGLKLKPYEYDEEISKFDITLEGNFTEKTLYFTYEYSTRLFERETVQRYIVYLKNIMAAVLAEPGVRISEIEIITEEEKTRLQYEFNATAAEYPGDRALHRQIEEQALRTPDRLALIAAALYRTNDAQKNIQNDAQHNAQYNAKHDAKHDAQNSAQHNAKHNAQHDAKDDVQDDVQDNVQLTYGRLNRDAGRQACRLQKKGVAPGDIVAIMAEPTVEMIVGIQAILKTGAAYLPIAPGTPLQRIDYMLRDSAARYLLADKRKMEGTPSEIPVLQLGQEDRSEENGGTRQNDTGKRDTGNLAYVIYTSGSTGNPKGVIVEHRALSNLCSWHNRSFRVTPRDRTARYAGFGFDAAVWEIFPYLVAGAALCQVPENIKLDTEKLNRYYHKHDVTITFLPTQMCEQFQEQDNRSLRILLTGGDKLNRYRKRRYRLVNNYGPTENTVVTSSYTVEENSDNIAIGKPLDNTEVHVLDRFDRQQPVGVPGELCIRSDGLARGYLNRPQLTAEKFVAIPAGTGKTMYRTGDRVRWRQDGNLEFLGRIDNQVKIRGYRIELGEIENRLANIDGLKEAVVIAAEDRYKKDKYLVAYIVPEEGKTIAIQEIKEQLAQSLPAYMIPAGIVEMETIPLTPNGKIDRKALPEPGAAGDGSVAEAPGNETERELLELWESLLPIEKNTAGIDDNFFELGGHSLKATVLAAAIKKKFQVNVPLTEIFKHPTIRRQAAIIKTAEKEKYRTIPPAEEKEYYDLSSGQKRLYTLQQLDRNSVAYNIPTMVRLEGNIDREKIEAQFKKIIRRHEGLRTGFEIVNGEPVQKIHQHIEFQLKYHLENESSEAGEEIIANFVKPFDLTQPPLMRAALLRETETQHILMLDLHHIIADGASMAQMVKEMMDGYAGKPGEELKIRHRDYSEWQNRRRRGRHHRGQEEYWLKRFAGPLPDYELPTDYERKTLQSFEGDTVEFKISSRETDRLKEMAVSEGVTLFMVLQAVVGVVLHKITGAEDIVIGTPVEGRTHDQLRGLIGMLVNTLALRNTPKGGITFREYLGEVGRGTGEAFENQDYQFEELVEKLELKRKNGRNPLFDVTIVYQNTDMPELEVPGLKLKPHEYRHPLTKFDITVIAGEKDGQLNITLRYRTQLYNRGTIQRYADYIKDVAEKVTENIEIKLEEINLIHELVTAEASTVQTSFVF